MAAKTKPGGLPPCDLDCLHCTRPPEKCHGGCNAHRNKTGYIGGVRPPTQHPPAPDGGTGVHDGAKYYKNGKCYG